MNEELIKFYDLITTKKTYKKLIFEGITFDQIVYQIDDITKRAIKDYNNMDYKEKIILEEEENIVETKEKKSTDNLDCFSNISVDINKITAKDFFEILDKNTDGSEDSSEIESDYLEERELNQSE